MVTGGNKLGDLTVGIRAPLGSFKQDLTQAEGAATQTGGKIGGAFGRAQSKIQGAARQVPIFGDQLALLATPTGAATLAFGGLTAAIGGSIMKVINLEKELRPMIARSGIAAEELQIFSIAAERLGSEDGLEGVTDSVQELQLRLAEATQDGTGPAVAAFEKLGLAAEDLIEKSPEDMFLAVITALQDLNNEADKKFLADELLGGSSEKLSGIIRTSRDDFAALNREIAQTHAIASGDALDSAAELSREMEKLGQTVDKVQLNIGMALIPVVNNLTDHFTAWKDETVEGFKWWGQLPGMLEEVVQGAEPIPPAIAEIGDGFEDMANSVLEDAARTFDPVIPGSFPYMVDDGMNTAVQAMQEGTREILHQHQLIVEANRAQGSREEQLEARRAELRRKRDEARRKRNKDLEDEIEDLTDAVEEDLEDAKLVTALTAAEFAELGAAVSELDNTGRVAFPSLESSGTAAFRGIEEAAVDTREALWALEDQLADAERDAEKEQKRLKKEHTEELLRIQAEANEALQRAVDEANKLEMEKAEEFWQRYREALQLAKEEETRIIKEAAIERYQIQMDAQMLEMQGLRELREETFNQEVEGHRTRGDIARDLHMLRIRGITDEESLGQYETLMRELWSYRQATGGISRLNDVTTGQTTRVLTGDAFETFLSSQLSHYRSGFADIPAMADGGIVMRPTMALIGESGPEAVVPLNRAGGAGGTINVIVGEGAYVFDDMIDAVAEAVTIARLRGHTI